MNNWQLRIIHDQLNKLLFFCERPCGLVIRLPSSVFWAKERASKNDPAEACTKALASRRPRMGIFSAKKHGSFISTPADF